MQVQPIDAREVLRKRVDATLRRSPVELVAPIARQLLEIVPSNTVAPLRVIDLVGQAGPRNPLAQIVDSFVADGKLKWPQKFVQCKTLQPCAYAISNVLVV